MDETILRFEAKPASLISLGPQDTLFIKHPDDLIIGLVVTILPCEFGFLRGLSSVPDRNPLDVDEALLVGRTVGKYGLIISHDADILIGTGDQ